MFRPKPIKPKQGQESVWDYPRPPKLERATKELKAVLDGNTIAKTNAGYRVLETSHPPNYYFPLTDIDTSVLVKSTRTTFCEWKGMGSYYHLKSEKGLLENVAWFYSNPNPNFAAIKNYVAFYAQFLDACYVDGELVTPQPGGFYGGWITKDIVGPFKGVEGSWGW